jgi:uncharacterized protein involved in exopolysaccharide biosynthesis
MFPPKLIRSSPIEIRPFPRNPDPLPPARDAWDWKTQRFLLFAIAFLVCLTPSLAYVWLREPVYRVEASLLTVAPPDIDAGSSSMEMEDAAAAAPVEAGGQRVMIERRALLGVPLLRETLKLLQEGEESEAYRNLNTDELQDILSVAIVEETDMVELSAKGARAAILAPIVNAWIDAYQSFRERMTRESKDTTRDKLLEEAKRLRGNIETKRAELDRFRREHGILSKTSEDNHARAKLKGLNDMLNKAEEEAVKTKAALDAVKASIARGEPVAPKEEQASLAALEKRRSELREQLTDMKRRYTLQYMTMQPQLKLVPEQLRKLEAEIDLKLQEGKRQVLSQAEQAYAAAAQSARDIRRQLQGIQNEAAEFTARFNEQEAMQADLEKLEEIQRGMQARLARVESDPLEHYPQLRVVDRAYPPHRPIWPDYWGDSGLALGGSAGFALGLTILYDYLTRRPRLTDPSSAPISPNIQIYVAPDKAHPGLSAAAAPESLPDRRVPHLERPMARELGEAELRQLLEAGDIRARQLIGLALSGLALAEIGALREDACDWPEGRLRVGGAAPRVLPLAERLGEWLRQGRPIPVWASDAGVELEELAASIACAAIDSGLPDPSGIDAEALRHTYIAYLVRQGIRLSDLGRVVGNLPAQTLAAYGRFSPPGPGLGAEAIPLIHPVLARQGMIAVD